MAVSWSSPLYFWSFNNGDLQPDIERTSGSAITLEVQEDGLWEAFSTDFYGTGTTLGVAPGYSAGESLSHFELIGVITGLRITISGLNFSGLSGIELSFASRNLEIGEFGELFTLEIYSAGDWGTPIVLSNPDSAWALYDPDIGGALDNEGDARIRLTSASALELAGILSFDNILFVPEPSSTALVMVAGAVLLFRRRAKKQNGGR